jgi:hypothetical protein
MQPVSASRVPELDRHKVAATSDREVQRGAKRIALQGYPPKTHAAVNRKLDRSNPVLRWASLQYLADTGLCQRLSSVDLTDRTFMGPPTSTWTSMSPSMVRFAASSSIPMLINMPVELMGENIPPDDQVRPVKPASSTERGSGLSLCFGTYPRPRGAAAHAEERNARRPTCSPHQTTADCGQG